MNDGREEDFGWFSYHIFYHGRLDLAVAQLVFPSVQDLWARNRGLRFFFVRYGLGGPHIRLRLSCAPPRKREIDRLLCRRAASFFDRSPSTESLSEVAIRKENRLILATDHDGIDAVYPDNSMIELPFYPEVERYGGAGLIDSSLAFFVISSIHALRFIRSQAHEKKSRFLAAAMRTLLRQALGSAASEEELCRLLVYAVGGHEGGWSRLLERADQEFERQPESYCRLVYEELAILQDPDARGLPGSLLTEAARLLRAQIGGASGQARWQILDSQLHMTANRIGLRVPEEVFLGRILGRAVRQVSGMNPAAYRCFAREQGGAGGGLDQLVHTGLEKLFTSSFEEESSSSLREGALT